MLEYFYLASLCVQAIHGTEALLTGTHRRWYVFKTSFAAMFVWEVLFLGFWVIVYALQSFPFREYLMPVFMLLMFANGLQHVIWASWEKRYVPGLITAPLHVVVFVLYFFWIL